MRAFHSRKKDVQEEIARRIVGHFDGQVRFALEETDDGWTAHVDGSATIRHLPATPTATHLDIVANDLLYDFSELLGEQCNKLRRTES